MYSCTTDDGMTASEMSLIFGNIDKDLSDYSEQDIYNPYNISGTYMLNQLLCIVKRIPSKTISNVYSGLEYTFTVQNNLTDSKTFNTIYVSSHNANNVATSSSYVLSIHRLPELITLAPQDIYQIEVTYDNLVAETPSNIASD